MIPIHYACLTNFVALKGGSIKREQMISGDMADVFSNLCMAICVQYYQKKNNVSGKLTDYIVKKLVHENQCIINKIIDNLSHEKYLLYQMKKSSKPPSYQEERELFNEIMKNPFILQHIKKNIAKIAKNRKKRKDYLVNKENTESILFGTRSTNNKNHNNFSTH